MRQYLLFCLVGLVAARCGQKETIFDSDEEDCVSDTRRVPSIFDRDNGSSGCGLRRRSNSVEISTSAIARLLLDADSKMQRFCTAHSDRRMREVYGVDHFQLHVSLSEFSEEDIQVRVRQRLVSVQAKSCTDEYAAVRILPEVVHARDAVWKFDGDTLTVLFPYNSTPDTEVQSRCGRRVSDSVIVVPQCAADRTFDPDYDVSFGDTNLRAAIRRYLAELATKAKSGTHSSNDYVEDDK